MSDIFNKVELNFGGFAHLVNLARDDSKTKSQAYVIAKMVSVVDSGNRCIIIGTNSDIEGEKTVVNHLLKCNQKFTLTCSFGELLERKDVLLNDFKFFVDNVLDPDKIPLLVITLIYIMANDDYMKNRSKELFKQVFGCYYEEFFPVKKINVCEFLLNLMLYVVSPKLSADYKSTSVSKMKLNELLEIYRLYSDEVIYDCNSHCIHFPFVDDYYLYFEMTDKYKIGEFIITINPLKPKGFGDYYLDCFDSFGKEVNENLLYNKPRSFFRDLIQNQQDLFNEYSIFLGIHMAYDPDKSRFVYIKHDEYDFGIKCTDYREKCTELIEQLHDYVRPFEGLPIRNTMEKADPLQKFL